MEAVRVAAGPRSLAAPREAAAALSSAGLDVLSTANNHSLDAGREGRKCTGEILTSLGILALDAPSVPEEIRTRGIDIRFLAFDFTGEVTEATIDDLERPVKDAPAGADILWGHHPHVVQGME